MIKMNHCQKNAKTEVTVISELRWKSVPTNGHSTEFFEVILPLVIAQGLLYRWAEHSADLFILNFNWGREKDTPNYTKAM